MGLTRHRIAALICACLVTPGAGLAAEYMHCYLREAPDDAPISSQYNVSALPSAVGVASLRHACGIDTTTDAAQLDAIVAAGECSPESEIAGFVRETFAVAPDELRAGYVSESSEEMMTRLCKVAATCEPTAHGYSDACQAAIDAAMDE